MCKRDVVDYVELVYLSLLSSSSPFNPIEIRFAITIVNFTG